MPIEEQTGPGKKRAARQRAKAAGKYGRGGRGMGTAVSIAECDPIQLRSCVAAVTAAGDAILFSLTTSGGIVAITIFSDNGPDKLYAKSQEELAETLQEITLDAAESML